MEITVYQGNAQYEQEQDQYHPQVWLNHPLLDQQDKVCRIQESKPIDQTLQAFPVLAETLWPG